jgi:hypothetical protein
MTFSREAQGLYAEAAREAARRGGVLVRLDCGIGRGFDDVEDDVDAKIWTRGKTFRKDCIVVDDVVAAHRSRWWLPPRSRLYKMKAPEFDPKALGSALSNLAGSTVAGELHQRSSLKKSSQWSDRRSYWLAGGCWALARAFRQWTAVGELVGVDFVRHRADWELGHLHVLVKLGEYYFDALGAARKAGVLAHWNQQMGRKVRLVPFEETTARGVIKCPWGVVRDLVWLMQEKLGSPSTDWGIPGAAPAAERTSAR